MLKLLLLLWISSTALAIETIPLEEKVGQLLMVHFHGEIANKDAKILIQEVGVGGIIYYNWSNSLHSPEQVRHLSASLQKLTFDNRLKIPLFIATDQEGGVVTRLTQGFTIFPGNRALGETHEPYLAQAAAYAMGMELSDVGINMNFAPVVDISNNLRNSVIGIRSFGENPETVLAFGEKALQGYKQAKIMTTLKHFPGHGDVEIDSHEGLPINNKSLEQLEQMELLPFNKLAASTDLIMTAHLVVPAFDEKQCSTLSEKTLTYLAKKIGFDGVVISDSLVMKGVLQICQTVDEAAIQALIAGCDILLLGGMQLSDGEVTLELSVKDIQHIHQSIIGAIKSGRISETRVNQAYAKIINLKEKYLSPSTESIPCFNKKDHQALAIEIATKALKCTTQCSNTPFLNKAAIAFFVPKHLQNYINQTSISEIECSAKCYYFEDIKELKACTEAVDIFVAYSFNAWKTPSQFHLIQSLINTGKPVILVVLKDPLDASLFSNAALIYTTFSPQLPSLEVIFNKLKTLVN